MSVSKSWTSKLFALPVVALIVVAAISPAKAVASDESSQKLLSSFSGSSASLTAKQKHEIRTQAADHPDAYKATCIGIVATKATVAQKKLATARAKNVCFLVNQAFGGLQTFIAVRASSIKADAGRVLVTLYSKQSLVEPTPTPTPTGYQFLPCDTPGVDTNMTVVSQSELFDVRCAEDAQTPSEAVSFNPASSTPTLCELKDVSSDRVKFDHLMVGFPRKYLTVDPLKPTKIVAVPVDFADLPGVGKPSTLNLKTLQDFADYYEKVSYGKFKIDIHFEDSWTRMPGLQFDYEVSHQDYMNPNSQRTQTQKDKFMRAAVAAADPKVDFTGASVVVFVLPEGQTAVADAIQAFLGGDLPRPIQSNEGPLKNFFTAGSFMDTRPKWTYYAHEMGHVLLLPDYYLQSGNFDNDKNVVIPGGPFSAYEMMANQDGPSRTMSFWSRYLMGWTSDSNLHCNAYADFKDSSFTLEPIDVRSENLKVVVIRISDTKAVIVESRRDTPWDPITMRSRNGVIVYTVDTAINHGFGPLALIAPKGRGLFTPFKETGGQRQYDAMLYVGNSVDVAGLHITVNKKGATDVVSISKK